MLPITDFKSFQNFKVAAPQSQPVEKASVHEVPKSKLAVIEEMDRKIGEFMQRRCEFVNQMVKEIAHLEPGDRVLVKSGNQVVCKGFVVQAVFIKRAGLITYRVRKDDGEDFTNTDFRLIKIQE